MAQNGRLPGYSLRRIYCPSGRARLDRKAARSWRKMRKHARKHHGINLYPVGPRGAYRTYGEQLYFWRLYQSGRGNVAAVPGTSNHGWGKAVDVATQAMANFILKEGHKWGWSHDEGARVGEWWHFRHIH